jgi:hypothetical protein
VTYRAKDEVNLTPAQWKAWAVLYEPVAEGILLLKSTEGSLTVQEGQTWNSTYGFTNISTRNFNAPLRVDLEVVNKKVQSREQQNFTIAAPAPGDTTFFEITSSTLGKLGKNDVNVFVNNRILAELYYDNNYITRPDYLTVTEDETAPILDVTFDNRTLQNGDNVSSTPQIIITMVDENQFRFKSDTLGVTLLVSYPCTTSPCPFTRIPLSGDDVKWFAETASSNFRIEFTPQLTDGDYVLSAQVADASGNQSGAVPYEISFKVKSEPSISLTSVYPNPSSGDFFFTFLLTGNELPDDFLLEIFTTHGQRLRTFDRNSIQHFNIGTNQLLWDGREATGAYLPRGVYVYRMQIKTPTKETSTQGKLVLMR